MLQPSIITLLKVSENLIAAFFCEYVYKCAFSYLPLVENVGNGPISKILSDFRF